MCQCSELDVSVCLQCVKQTARLILEANKRFRLLEDVDDEQKEEATVAE